MIAVSSQGQFSQGVTLLSRWDSDQPPANGSNAKYNDCWGFVWNGEEYAAIGSTLGTHIIHLQANNAAVEVAFIQGSSWGDYIVHRDFDFYKGYLYAVCDQEPGSLQVIDCRNLPNEANEVLRTTEFFSTAHNLFMDNTTGKLYVSGPSGQAMSILDVETDPSNPTLLSHFNLVDYVHDCYVQNDTAYLHCGNQGFFIFDTSDPVNPIALGALTAYEEKGYNHSGWITQDGNHYIFTDETPGMRLKMCDITDLTDINVIDLFWSYSDPETMAHYVMIKGNLAYVSHYFDGLEIYDISNPENVQRVAWYDTFREENQGGRGAWGIHALLPSGRIIISDRQTGLYVFRLEEGVVYPRTPELQIAGNPGIGNVVVSLVDFDYREVLHEVYDSRGRLVSSGSWLKGFGSFIPIDLTTQEDGAYYIHITLDETSVRIGKYIKTTP